jgi:hypothetical protein
VSLCRASGAARDDGSGWTYGSTRALATGHAQLLDGSRAIRKLSVRPPAAKASWIRLRPHSRLGSRPSGSRSRRTHALGSKSGRGRRGCSPSAAAHCTYAADRQRIADAYWLTLDAADAATIREIVAGVLSGPRDAHP